MADDRDAPHAQQWATAVCRRIEKVPERLQLARFKQGGTLSPDELGDQSTHRLVELQHDIPHEAVAHDDVNLPVAGMRHHDVAALDVADVPDARLALEQHVRLANHRPALFVLFADVEQPHLGLRYSHEIAHVDGAKPREVHQLLRCAIDVRAGIDHQHRALDGRKWRGHGRAIHAVVQAQKDGRTRKRGAGVPRRDEGVDLTGAMQVQADHQGGIGFLAHGGERPLRHADHVGRGDDPQPGPIDVAVAQ